MTSESKGNEKKLRGSHRTQLPERTTDGHGPSCLPPARLGRIAVSPPHLEQLGDGVQRLLAHGHGGVAAALLQRAHVLGGAGHVPVLQEAPEHLRGTQQHGSVGNAGLGGTEWQSKNAIYPLPT